MLIPLFSLVAPFLLWPIEYILPYPHIIEELVKGLFVYFILKFPNKDMRIRLALLSGLFFAFSETVLYMSNILLLGTLTTLFERFLLTTTLHIVTFFIILLSGMKRRDFLPLGVVVAIIAHYFFNFFVGRLTTLW